jgi:hypothetical protein
MTETAKLVERFCVVCGQGSHRADWQDASAPACDSHSKDEVAAALKAKADKPAAKTA